MAKKPSVAAIGSAVPLTSLRARHAEPLSVCTICGRPIDASDLTAEVWREHDDRDRPIPGIDALIFVGRGSDHASCRKAIDDHPRLYAEVPGAPGHFPGLCGPCVHRDGFACTHPDLRANGGPGLKVTLDGVIPGAIICGRGGRRITPIARGAKCVGRELPRETTEAAS